MPTRKQENIPLKRNPEVYGQFHVARGLCKQNTQNVNIVFKSKERKTQIPTWNVYGEKIYETTIHNKSRPVFNTELDMLDFKQPYYKTVSVVPVLCMDEHSLATVAILVFSHQTEAVWTQTIV